MTVKSIPNLHHEAVNLAALCEGAIVINDQVVSPPSLASNALVVLLDTIAAHANALARGIDTLDAGPGSRL